MTRLCDFGLGVILPFHSHVAMNAVISDYIPYAYRSALPQLSTDTSHFASHSKEHVTC